MLKLKLQYFGHLMWRADSSEKTLMLGNIEGGRRRGRQRMRWLDGITASMDISLSQTPGNTLSRFVIAFLPRNKPLNFMAAVTVCSDFGAQENKNCPCFSTYCLGLSSLSCQEAVVFWFHGCSHCLQWFWSPRRGNLSLLPPFPFYLPCSNGAGCHYLSFFNI